MKLRDFAAHVVLAVGACLALGSVNGAAAATINLGTEADTYLRDATVRGALDIMDVRGAALDFRGYARFNLSSLGPINITSASLLLTVNGAGGSRNDAANNGRYATYGLNNVVGNTPQNWDETAFVPATKGTENVDTLTGVTDLDDNVAGLSEVFNPVAGSAVAGTTVTISGAPLVAFLQSRANDGGLATFILSNDDATDRGYALASKENANTAFRPLLTIEYTAVPEPATLVLVGMIAAAGLGWSRRRAA